MCIRDRYETGFDQLLRELLGAPLFQKPPLGAAPTLQPQSSPKATMPDPVAQFMKALAEVYEHSTANGGVDTDVVQNAMGASKLFFDHAFDMAIQQDLVKSSVSKAMVWVVPKGRALMLSLIHI